VGNVLGLALAGRDRCDRRARRNHLELSLMLKLDTLEMTGDYP
jgi:hypothetical protein